MSEKPIPEDEWRAIVENVPLVSVDLVVEYDGGIVLGKRENEPAKGEWFVPGGCIQKAKPIREAVHWVAGEELGVNVTIKTELGTYDHFHETADLPDADSKHYVAHNYHVTPDSETVELDAQHNKSDVFPIRNLPELHPYVEAYLANSGLLDTH